MKIGKLSKQIILTNQKKYKNYKQYPLPRLYWTKQKGKISSSVLIKCGDCENKFRIYYDENDKALEINGVIAHIDCWKVLLNELEERQRGN